jgi:mono/diheme cytochrome c family protein
MGTMAWQQREAMMRDGTFGRAAAVAACVAAATLATAGAARAQDAAIGAQLFAEACAVCHGAEARGNGLMAPVLTVVPPDLTRLGEGGRFPVLDVVRHIDGRERRPAHGGDMPIFGRWFEGDGVDVAISGAGGQPMLVSRPIADLVAFLLTVQS